MLQTEFQEMVGMVVSPEEYAAIEMVYTNSDFNVSKTEFCYFWSKINKERIKNYKARLREQEKRSRIIDRLWNIISRLNVKDNDLAVNLLRKSEKDFLDKLGFNYKTDSNGNYMFKYKLVIELRRKIDSLK